MARSAARRHLISWMYAILTSFGNRQSVGKKYLGETKHYYRLAGPPFTSGAVTQRIYWVPPSSARALRRTPSQASPYLTIIPSGKHPIQSSCHSAIPIMAEPPAGRVGQVGSLNACAQLSWRFFSNFGYGHSDTERLDLNKNLSARLALSRRTHLVNRVSHAWYLTQNSQSTCTSPSVRANATR